MISFEISHGYTFTKQLQYQISFVCVLFFWSRVLLQRCYNGITLINSVHDH